MPIINLISVLLPRFACLLFVALSIANCAQVQNSHVKATKVVDKKAEIMSNNVATRPANLESLLQQQSIIDNIMTFLKEEIKEGEAGNLVQRAEERLNVKYKFVENKLSTEGRYYTDFLTNASVDENGVTYEDGRVDVFDGGLIPGTMYSTYNEVYSEGAAPKYIDLFLKYDQSNGMVCLNSSEFSGYAIHEGYRPDGGVSPLHSRLHVGIFTSDKRAILYQSDDSGVRRTFLARRYSLDYPYETEDIYAACAKKIGIRINY